MKSFKTLFLFLALALTSSSFTSCSDEDDEPKFANVTLNAGETKIIDHAAGIHWTSSNQFVAEMNDNELKALRVGTATLSSTRGHFKVKVNPTSHLYQDPCMQFGASQSTVRSWMKSHIPQAVWKENSKPDLLFYTCTEGAAMIYGYGFDNKKLSRAMLFVNHRYGDELVTFLTERYIVVTVDEAEGYVGLISPEKDMLVVVIPDVLGGVPIYNVVYAPNEETKGCIDYTKIIQPYTKSARQTKQSTDTFKLFTAKMKAAQ